MPAFVSDAYRPPEEALGLVPHPDTERNTSWLLPGLPLIVWFDADIRGWLVVPLVLPLDEATMSFAPEDAEHWSRTSAWMQRADLLDRSFSEARDAVTAINRARACEPLPVPAHLVRWLREAGVSDS